MGQSGVMGNSHTGWASTVWIDPGGTTGWAVMNVDPHDLVSEEKPIEHMIQHWACGDYQGNEDQMASACLELFDVWDEAAIGVESFTIRKFIQSSEFLSPVRVRSKIEYGLWLMEKWAAMDAQREMGSPRHLFRQSPLVAKSTLTNDRQHEYGLWVPGTDHKRDATKHCYTFLSRARKNARLRAFAWPSLFKSSGKPRKKLPPTSKQGRY